MKKKWGMGTCMAWETVRKDYAQHMNKIYGAFSLCCRGSRFWYMVHGVFSFFFSIFFFEEK